MIHTAVETRKDAFSALPIRVKLLIIIVGICISALLLSAVFETAVNWKSEREQRVRQNRLVAEMIGLQVRAALEFIDPKAARENLNFLEPNQQIVMACLYNEAGEHFTSYVRRGETHGCPTLGMLGERISWQLISGFYEIRHNNRKLGAIYLERELHDMYARLTEQIIYKIIILLLVILMVWPLSNYLQRSISQPIIQLAYISRIFAKDRKQRLEMDKPGDDELGELVDSYNQMMEEIRQNELQLAQAIAELTRSNTELERFAHICSHDLQEPLRMVSNYTALLEKRMEGKLDEETGQYLYFITDGAARMRDLINDILTYARIGHHVEPMHQVELNSLVDYVLKNMSSSIKEREAVIHKADLPTVYGNKTLLVQIFQNLISNAVKFCLDTPEIWIDAKKREGEWEFSVRDNGIGIDAKYHDKIFEIFRRLNRREQFRGTGIGLAIFKKAVEFHGGRLWLESEPGKGTAFFFTIPAHTKEEP